MTTTRTTITDRIRWRIRLERPAARTGGHRGTGLAARSPVAVWVVRLGEAGCHECDGDGFVIHGRRPHRYVADCPHCGRRPEHRIPLLPERLVRRAAPRDARRPVVRRVVAGAPERVGGTGTTGGPA